LVSLYGHHRHCPSLSRFAVEHVGTYERKKDSLSLSQVCFHPKKRAPRALVTGTQVSMSNEKSGKQKKKPRQLPVVPNRPSDRSTLAVGPRNAFRCGTTHVEKEPPFVVVHLYYIDALNARYGTHIHKLICVVWMCARRLFAVLTVGPIAPCHLFAVR